MNYYLEEAQCKLNESLLLLRVSFEEASDLFDSEIGDLEDKIHNVQVERDDIQEELEGALEEIEVLTEALAELEIERNEALKELEEATEIANEKKTEND